MSLVRELLVPLLARITGYSNGRSACSTRGAEECQTELARSAHVLLLSTSDLAERRTRQLPRPLSRHCQVRCSGESGKVKQNQESMWRLATSFLGVSEFSRKREHATAVVESAETVRLDTVHRGGRRDLPLALDATLQRFDWIAFGPNCYAQLPCTSI